MSAPSLPSYEKLAALFKKAKADLDPAHAHGILCGHLCITPDLGTADPKFKKIALDDNDPSYPILSDLYEASYHALKQFSFEFSLILPNDDIDLNKRVKALGLWCQGFLTSVTQSSALDAHSEKEIDEALNDISEIAEVKFDDILESEEDEAAYVELVEYTRLAALMIFNTMQARRSSEQPDVLLH